MEQSTYIIKRSQIENAFSMKEYVLTVEKAFRLCGEGKVQMPSKVYLYFSEGDLRCMPVYIPPMKIAGVKNVNVHPSNRDKPTVMATITLFDPDTGFPMAIMDGTHITNMRTGAAGGVAAKYLSRKDSKVAAFVGAGVQAKTQLEALIVARPNISKVRVYDIQIDHMERFAENAKKLGLDVECTASVKDAVTGADILVTTTPSKQPIIKSEFIAKGMHINAIGADAAGKQELDPKILKKAVIVVDKLEQASHSGEINVAFSKGIIRKEDVYAEIGEIVVGKKTGRQSEDQITIFDSTGLAIQDISVAIEIYKRLTSDKNIETTLQKVDFLS